MKRILTAMLAITLVFMLAMTAFAQTPEIEKNMQRLAELRDKMANASSDEYQKLKAEFDKLSAETEKMVREYNNEKANKSRAISLYNEGNDALRARRFDQAIQSFKQSIELNPMEPRAYYSLGLAYQFRRRYNEALDSFRKAAQVDPSYIKAFYAQGVLLNRMGQLNEAVESFRKAISIQNADADDLSKAYAGLGLAFYKQNNFDQAIGAYTKAVELYPRNDDAWYNLAKTYADKKDYKNSVDALRKATELEPRNHKYLSALAEKYNRLGNYSQAAQAAQAATSINNNFAAAWFELGWAYENMGRDQDAIAAYQKAMNDRTYRQSAEYQIKSIKGEF